MEFILMVQTKGWIANVVETDGILLKMNFLLVQTLQKLREKILKIIMKLSPTKARFIARFTIKMVNL